jgi:hypothetical protein
MDGASAALGDPAPEFRAGQTQLVAQHPQEWRIVRNVDIHGFLIERKIYQNQFSCWFVGEDACPASGVRNGDDLLAEVPGFDDPSFRKRVLTPS